MKNQPHEYYRDNKARFIADGEAFLQFFRQAAQARIGRDAEEIAASALERFSQLLPDLPYIGGDDNFLTGNLISGAVMLCLYQTMQPLGYETDLVGQLVYESICLMTQERGHAPAPDAMQAEQIIRERKQAGKFSQENPYPYGWSTMFIEGDGKTFDWGVDYASCGICRLFEEQDAAAFIPYLCALDQPLYRARGIGLVRTETLARGNQKCDFRFNLRGEHSLEWLPDFYSTDGNPPVG